MGKVIKDEVTFEVRFNYIRFSLEVHKNRYVEKAEKIWTKSGKSKEIVKKTVLLDRVDITPGMLLAVKDNEREDLLNALDNLTKKNFKKIKKLSKVLSERVEQGDEENA